MLLTRSRRTRSRWTGVWWGLCVGLLSALAASPVGAEVWWRSPAAPSPRQKAPDVRTAVTALAARRGQSHVVAHFASPVQTRQRAALGAAGLELLAYLGDNAYFASLASEGIDAAGIASDPMLSRVEAVRVEWKLHRSIVENDYPDYAVGPDPRTGLEMAAANVLFHHDAAFDTAGVAAALRHEARIVSEIASLNGLVIELPLANLRALAEEDAVQWIEPPLPFMTVTNDSNRVVTQADDVQSAPYNLSGAGINVLVYDGGYALASHADFGGRLTVRDSSGLSDHATHVCGTVGGSGSGSSGTYRGMAPSVTIQSYGFEYDGSNIFLYSNPGDIQQDYNEAINTYGVDLANNSIGTNTAPNGFDCAITGDYGVTSALIDAIVGGSLGAPFRIVWANGNERQTTRCGSTYFTTAPPACAKNHITVGALNSNNDSMTSFSSWGPADDGRLKPDISGPGCQSSGDGGVTSTSSAGGYTVKCGTSMSSPTVTGLLSLVLEDYRVQFPSLADPRNSTLKVLLAHNAVDRGNTGPDYQYGYGSVRVRDTIDFMRTGNFTEDQVAQGGAVTYLVEIIAGAPELKVTLAWDDAPGTPNVVPSLINDLDLVVVGPSSQRAYPWTLDPANPANTAVQTQEDHLNNIEQVLVSSPESGTWTVEVRGNAVPSGPQVFSISVSPGFTQDGLFIGLPSGTPTEILPGIATTIPVEISAIGESYVGGSGTLHYRYDGGTYQTSPLTSLGGNAFEATLPAAGCADVPEYYFSAQGTVSGTVLLPVDAPTSVYSSVVGETVVVFSDDFETDQGWVAQNLGATSGDWQRGVPVNDPGWAYDPESDSDGSGQCYLTQNQTGNTDVDAGAVRLTSPTLDMSGGNVTINYDYYLYLTNTTGGVDRLLVEIDGNDGAGPWTEIARHDTDGGLTWRAHVIQQVDLNAAGVTLTSTMKLRFTTNDGDPQSINESGLDAVVITAFSCAVQGTCADGVLNQGEVRIDCGGPCPPCNCTSNGECDDADPCNGVETCDAYGVCQSGPITDCNGNGVDDACDLSGGFSDDCNGNGIPDECDIAGGGSEDCNGNGVPDECDVPPALPAADAGGPVTACADALDPAVGGSPTASGGTGPYSYAWTGGGAAFLSGTTGPNPTFDVSAVTPGTYQVCVQVTDANTCVSTVDCADVTVDACITVNLQIEGLIGMTGTAERDVTFVVTGCPGAPDTRVETVTFTPGAGVGVGSVVLTGVDPGALWLSVSEGHTLRKLLNVDFSTSYADTLDFTAGNKLLAGDLQTTAISQDNLVDIQDFSVLSVRWNTPVTDCGVGDPNPENCPYGADITGDGIQDTADFTALQQNFFLVGEDADGCFGPLPDPGPPPPSTFARMSIRVADLALVLPGAAAADLTGDGVVDGSDIRAFAVRHKLRLLPAFERCLTRAEAAHRDGGASARKPPASTSSRPKQDDRLTERKE